MNHERSRVFSFDGLDGTGKTTLTKMLQKSFGGIVVYSPPDWMKRHRNSFNENVALRFFYYAFGNAWLDRFVIRPHLENSDTPVFQDRSWLSTLAAHDILGVSTFWMNRVYSLAKTATEPIQAFVLHVDNEERRRRLVNRNAGNPGDIKSLDLLFEQTTESKHIQWAERLGWKTVLFDNTNFTSESARDALTSYIEEGDPLKISR